MTAKKGNPLTTIAALTAFASALLIGPTAALIMWTWIPLVVGVLAFTAIMFVLIVIGVAQEHRREQKRATRRAEGLVDREALRRLAGELRRGEGR